VPLVALVALVADQPDTLAQVQALAQQVKDLQVATQQLVAIAQDMQVVVAVAQAVLVKAE
jgi:ABC-type sugar transport system ATPase subunit